MDVLGQSHHKAQESRSPGAVSFCPGTHKSIARHRGVVFRFSLITAVLAVLFWSLAGPVVSSKSASPAASPTPAPSPPVIEFQAVPDREVTERDEKVATFVIITNKSDKSVNVIDVIGSSKAFTVEPLKINAALKSFESLQKELTIAANNDATFTPHKVSLLMQYSWDAGGQQVTSAQSTTISMEVRRRFEEEAKGFPGGTAAFLYLLLPILPALLSYQLIDRLRKDKKLQMPSFSTDQLVPAFFLAVVFSFLVVLVAKSDHEINYSEPRVFLSVLAISVAAGAAIPGIHALIDYARYLIWGFKDNDSGEVYLHRALTSRRSPDKFVWATGRVGEEKWEGMLFEQPGGKPVLGATVRVTRAKDVSSSDWAKMKSQIFDDENRLLDAAYLEQMLRTKRVTVATLDKVKRGDDPHPGFVVVKEIEGFIKGGEKPNSNILVRPV
jgi:hypothetical protein